MQKVGTYIVMVVELDGKEIGYKVYDTGKLLSYHVEQLKPVLRKNPRYLTNGRLEEKAGLVKITSGRKEEYPREIVKVKNISQGREGGYSLLRETRRVENKDTLVVIEDQLLTYKQVIAVNAKGERVVLKAVDLPKYKYANVDVCKKSTTSISENVEYYLRKKRECL